MESARLSQADELAQCMRRQGELEQEVRSLREARDQSDQLVDQLRAWREHAESLAVEAQHDRDELRAGLGQLQEQMRQCREEVAQALQVGQEMPLMDERIRVLEVCGINAMKDECDEWTSDDKRPPQGRSGSGRSSEAGDRCSPAQR